MVTLLERTLYQFIVNIVLILLVVFRNETHRNLCRQLRRGDVWRPPGQGVGDGAVDAVSGDPRGEEIILTQISKKEQCFGRPVHLKD